MANSIFKNALNRMVEARERQARRYVNSTLLSLDDTTLKAYGRSREEIEKEGYQTYGF